MTTVEGDASEIASVRCCGEVGRRALRSWCAANVQVQNPVVSPTAFTCSTCTARTGASAAADRCHRGTPGKVQRPGLTQTDPLRCALGRLTYATMTKVATHSAV